MTAGQATTERTWWTMMAKQSQVPTLPRWNVGVDAPTLVFQIFTQASGRLILFILCHCSGPARVLLRCHCHVLRSPGPLHLVDHQEK